MHYFIDSLYHVIWFECYNGDKNKIAYLGNYSVFHLMKKQALGSMELVSSKCPSMRMSSEARSRSCQLGRQPHLPWPFGDCFIWPPICHSSSVQPSRVRFAPRYLELLLSSSHLALWSPRHQSNKITSVYPGSICPTVTLFADILARSPCLSKPPVGPCSRPCRALRLGCWDNLAKCLF